jgi:hypothetical protein
MVEQEVEVEEVVEVVEVVDSVRSATSDEENAPHCAANARTLARRSWCTVQRSRSGEVERNSKESA